MPRRGLASLAARAHSTGTLREMCSLVQRSAQSRGAWRGLSHLVRQVKRDTILGLRPSWLYVCMGVLLDTRPPSATRN